MKVTVEHRGVVQQNPDEDSFQVDLPSTFNSAVTFANPSKVSVDYITSASAAVTKSYTLVSSTVNCI